MRSRLLLATFATLWLASLLNPDAASAANVFSSVAHMNDLMSLERRLVYKVGDFLHRMETKLGYLRSFLNDYYETKAYKDRQLTHSSAEHEYDSRRASPIEAYNTIKRLSVDWNKIVHHFREPDWMEIEKLMVDSNDTFPRSSDLLDAGEALTLIQKTYRLNITDMAKGVIKGHKAKAPLTARDCLYFGQLLYNQYDFEPAIKWFEEALTRLSIEKQPSITAETVHSYLDSSLLQLQEQQRLQEDEQRMQEDQRYSTETETEANPKVPSLTRPFAEGYLETFNDLCRGEKIRNATEEKDLRCYLSVPHPYFRIGPVKMEVMSLDPYIVQFYDVIWPEEIRAIRKLGDPMLSRATVRETTEAMVSHGRISQVAWLSPDTDPLLERVNERVAMLTGLSTDYEAGDSEIIQYNSYGPGGHYEPHHDYLLGGLTEEQLEQVDEDEKFTGDRIATFMFYLSDVSLGGSTAFPYAKAAVSPRRGSAAFWYNMREDGSYDVNTLHGACSVAHGTKQVANVWIRTNGQMFRRPCPVTKQQRTLNSATLSLSLSCVTLCIVPPAYLFLLLVPFS
ncbi:prolyl 4-hydroxylase subunit alpha-2 isoform X2 [Dermacentor silvarum]|uniref:prolyl 4-hydroxylase subunit alpha-2 isoform X2 n=1 Tax=Dermacentor silvarum TaxID=543639 RepID=UPI00210180C2|nr:prolyl 4-hydroxylase subunit alpha-2 isoform X2 [Dermacentor silvarum]